MIARAPNLTPRALGRRWGEHRPQLAAILVMIGVYAAWGISLWVPAYIAGVLIFFEVWSMASVYIRLRSSITLGG
jgi:presenilin-like A22 family membrane protease